MENLTKIVSEQESQTLNKTNYITKLKKALNYHKCNPQRFNTCIFVTFCIFIELFNIVPVIYVTFYYKTCIFIYFP